MALIATHPNVHQISKHITFSQKKLARNEKWMMKAVTQEKRKKNKKLILLTYILGELVGRETVTFSLKTSFESGRTALYGALRGRIPPTARNVNDIRDFFPG